jgi:carbonic anhydrase
MSAAEKPARAVVTCMDYRVKESVILAHMGWDAAYFIRNAGGVVTADVVRSLMLLQKFVLKEKYDIEILVVTHTGCGMLVPSDIGDNQMRNEIENDIWICETPPFALESFPTPELGVRRSVQRLRTSYFVSSRTPRGLRILGQVYDVDNHKLSVVRTHVVEAGQDWTAVARLYGITVDALKKANPQAIRPDNLLGPGQVLYIPVP